MGLYRYTASADNTITNAFRSNLTGRGTGSNMGAADVLEAFYITGQTSASAGLSSEKSRILIQFDTDALNSDRTSGKIPASGSVSWNLRLYNARHASALPKNFKMVAKVISGSWQEGTGLDMDEYTDQTYELIPGSNWIKKGLNTDGFSSWLTEGGDFADSSLSPAVASDTFSDGTEDLSIDVSDMVEDWITGGAKAVGTFRCVEGGSVPADYNNAEFTLTDSQGTFFVFHLDSSTTVSSGHIIGIKDLGSNNLVASKVKDAINATGVLRITATIPDGDNQSVTLTMDDIGLAGNNNGGLGNIDITGSAGDQFTISNNFQNGTGIPNYGFGIMLSGSFETGSVSQYTKKFFSRSTEYFFKRPVLEARWDSTEKDRAGNFYGASYFASQDDQVNTIYLYNYVRGQLKDIPDLTNNVIYVTFHSGNADNSAVAENASRLTIRNKEQAIGSTDTKIVGGKISTGIYTASVIYPAAPDSSNASPATSIIFPVWQNSVSAGGAAGVKFHTGSAITVKSFNDLNANPNPEFVSSVTNLKDLYSTDETARFRLYVREKNWDPTIYTVANTEIENYIVEDAYYKVFRIIDDLEVIPFGTGSATSPLQTGSAESYTRLSYDISGNYFDLNMDLLESGYAYGIKLAYYSNNSYREQPEVFKFRIED
jgi:hypothetical protein